MKPLRIGLLALAIAASATAAGAQTAATHEHAPDSPTAGASPSVAPPSGGMQMKHPMRMNPAAGTADHQATDGMMAHASGGHSAGAKEPGQAAFAAIQEIVGLLQADPHTDWSKVDVDALRQHLIDMDEVTLRAAAAKTPIENGLRIDVTGSGRTREAIERMLVAHAHEIDGMHGGTVRASTIADGVELTLTADNPEEVQKIRALGFMGIMAQGGHHQMHHLAIAKGESMHMH